MAESPTARLGEIAELAAGLRRDHTDAELASYREDIDDALEGLRVVEDRITPTDRQEAP